MMTCVTLFARSVAVLAVAVSVALGGASAAAQPPSFEGLGRAPIAGGDRVRAQKRALDEALQRSVESAVASLLGADALTRRAADLRLKILPKARSYVTSYRTLEEGETEPGMYDVHVSAEVATERLLRDLADHPHDVRLPTAPAVAPRLILCASGEPLPLPSRLEGALRHQLEGQGFEVAVAVMPGCDPARLAADMPAEHARHALVVMVSAEAPSPIRGTALTGREGKLSLQLLEADGRRSATGDADAAGYGASAAEAADNLAVRALSPALAELGAALSTIAGTQAASSGGIPVRVVGARKLGQLAPLRAALEHIPGVDSVELRRIEPGIPATIELSVHTSQPARAIVDAANRMGATFQLRAAARDNGVVIEMLDPMDPGAGAEPTPGAPRP